MKIKKYEPNLKLNKHELSPRNRKLGVSLGVVSGLVLLGVAVTAIATPLAVRRYSAVTSATSPNQFQFQDAYDLVIRAQSNNNDTITMTAPLPKAFFQVNPDQVTYKWYRVTSIVNGQVYSGPVLGPLGPTSPSNPVNANFSGQNYIPTTRSLTVAQTLQPQQFYVTMTYPGFGENAHYTSPIITIPPFGTPWQITQSQATASSVANHFFNEQDQMINVANISSLKNLTLEQFVNPNESAYTSGIQALQSYIQNDLIKNGVTVPVIVYVPNTNNTKTKTISVNVSASDITIGSIQIMPIGSLLYVYLTYQSSTNPAGTGRVPLVFGGFASVNTKEQSSTANNANAHQQTPSTTKTTSK